VRQDEDGRVSDFAEKPESRYLDQRRFFFALDRRRGIATLDGDDTPFSCYEPLRRSRIVEEQLDGLPAPRRIFYAMDTYREFAFERTLEQRRRAVEIGSRVEPRVRLLASGVTVELFGVGQDYEPILEGQIGFRHWRDGTLWAGGWSRTGGRGR
jgi:hypothetical protein